MTSLGQKLLLLSISLFIIGIGDFHKAQGQDTTSSPIFNLNMQLHIYSVDTKTEIAHSSSFYVRMWTHDPEVSSFEVVILRPDYQEALRIISWNESGHQQIYEEIKTDPSEVSVPWQWHMNPRRPYGLGTPFDYYEVSFLIAVNMSTNLNLNDTWVNMALPLRGIWTWDEHPEVIKLSSAPDNKTLISHGLSPTKFYQYHCDTMTDFYLISEFLRFPFMDSCRVALAYFSPSIAIFLVLLVSGIKFKKMSRSDFLRLYLGAGLFILTFLVSFYQYAPSKVWTWQEVIFYADFLIITVLVIVALLTKHGESGNSQKRPSQIPSSKGGTKHLNSDKKLQIERLISEITSRESSTLVVSTVTASVSLAFLALVIQSQNSEWFDLAFWTGFLFSAIGFAYRELTIFGFEIKEYRILNSLVAPLTEIFGRPQKCATFVRMFILRFFLLIPAGAWILVRFFDMKSGWIAIIYIAMCAVALFFSLMEHDQRYDP